MYSGVYSRTMCTGVCTVGPCVHWCVQYDHVHSGVYSRAMCTVVCRVVYMNCTGVCLKYTAPHFTLVF